MKVILKQTYKTTSQTSKLVIALPNSLSKRVIENRTIKVISNFMYLSTDVADSFKLSRHMSGLYE
jgi:hypothetical protein